MLHAALRHGRGAGASAGIRPDARDRAAPRATTPHAAAAGSASSTTWTRRSADADIVIPKSWGCLDTMGSKPEESLPHRPAVQELDLQRGADGAGQARLPLHASAAADRGNEVTDEVIDGPQSVVYAEAENRLHTAKAIMALTMADRDIEYDA